MMSSQDSNRLYSWLWDSHISPKNSKWLPENLADIDATVKQMIKIIEEDGDSFAKRAEMYYKRRPELMRLVEQFYRAYRGLAERYSHATGVIRQAHHTMVEAFPGQVPPLLLNDECQADCKSTGVVNVAERLFGFDEKDVILGFGEEVLECGGEGKLVGNTSVLKDDKEDGLVRFEIILGRISSLESRATCAEEESRRQKEQANRARVEVQLLNDALRRSEAEKENAMVHYEQCVERISVLESELSQSSGDQIWNLKDALASAEAEKETILAQHSKCATMISSLQTKLINAEDEARRISERADMAEEEAEWLKKEIVKLEEEKEVASLVYWQSIEKISTLEKEFSSTQDDVLQLKGEINAATLKLQGAETRYLLLERSKDRLQSEMESLQQDIECQRQRLLEKQTEFSKVWTRVQEEVRFVTSQLRSKEELVEKCELRNESLENEIAKMNKVMENFIEQNLSSELSMEYLKSENEELRAKIVKLDEEVEVGVNLRNELQNEKKTFLEKMRSMEKVLEENAMMRNSLFDLNCALDESYAEPAFGCSYAPEEARVEIIVHKVEELKEELRQTLDNNELLGLEKSVLVMLFGELRQENAEAAKERKALLENLKTESRKLTVLENEAENLLKMNDMLGEKVNERSDYVEKLENDIRVLNVKFLDVQDSYRKLRIKDAKVLQENMSLRKEFLELKHKNRILEDENCTVLVESLSLSNASLVFKSFVTEKTVEVEELEKTTQRLERDLEMLQAENMHLARAVLNGKDLLREKESQLHLAEENLEDIKREKAHLEENFEVTKRDFSKARETQDAQLLKLLSDNGREIANNTFLHKMMKQLDTELAALQEQCEETEARGMPLIAELEIAKSEIKELFSKLLISSVREAVFSEKANELSEICRRMEKERIVESEEVKVLQEKVHDLEGENSAQNASLVALVASVESLRSSFLSLEGRTRRILESAEESEESVLDSDGTGDHNAALFRGLAKVQDLQNRMKALEHLIGDIGTLQTSENLATEIKCEVPMYEDLRCGCGDLNLNSQLSDVGIRKVPPEASFVDSETPKDITLDKASKLEHHGSSRTDDRMLELWEIGSEGQSIDLTVSKGHKAGNSVSEIIAEDEGLEIVDKLEISKRFIDSYQEENKRKMLEKLESDGLKLTNLQITIQDLMIKVSITEKTKKKDHDIEYNTVKEQLEEAEEAVTKLSEMNSKLKKVIQDNDLKSINGKSQSELEHAWNSRRRKILDHANRGAERLTSLQLEVQKLQFLLLKLDNEQEKKPKTRITDSGPKFLLKDYLHGRVRSVRLSGVNQSKKKILCGCILPPTKGDSPSKFPTERAAGRTENSEAGSESQM